METIQRIIALLKKNNLSAAQMCRDLGFSSGLFSQWKKEGRIPSAEKLREIALYFQVSVDYLLTGEEPPKREISDVRYALFHETADVSEDTLKQILEFARFARQQEQIKKKQKEETDAFDE